ncbi:hypothetical protein ACLOJK_018789 [Asimina triloba]
MINVGGEELGWERRGESSGSSVERRWNLVLSGRVGTVGERGEGLSVWGRELLEKESGLWQQGGSSRVGKLNGSSELIRVGRAKRVMRARRAKLSPGGPVIRM